MCINANDWLFHYLELILLRTLLQYLPIRFSCRILANQEESMQEKVSKTLLRIDIVDANG